jgi:hypothetical protein
MPSLVVTFLRRALAVLALLAVAAPAHGQGRGQRVELSLESGQAYADVPFVVLVVARGFGQDPAPAQPALSIPGATVTPAGVQPDVQQRTVIVNGRRTDSTEVTWLFRYKVVAKEGSYQVPPVTITQGATRASSPAARLQVRGVQSTNQMRLQLALPDRPVWVGETIEVNLDWLIARNVEDQSFDVPLLAMEDKVAIAVPPVTDRRRAISFTAGNRELDIPFVQERVDVGGQPFTRLRFSFLATPRQPGRIELAPATVVATLVVGSGGVFSRPDSAVFRARDAARTLEVKPLPMANRPGAFTGAVGTSFSIATRSSRSVVQLGEPVDLEVTIKSDGRLDALSLGNLDREGGLPSVLFTVPPDPPVGELSEDGKTKTFRIPVQVTGPATEIPALAFAYFEPVRGEYQTIRSEPIALSVKGGGAVVGAADVVGTTPAKKAPAASAAPGELSLVGADLALSSPADALDRPLSGGLLWGLVLALYGLAILVFAARTYQVRTADRREERGEVVAARRAFEAALERAATVPAVEAASALPAALRQLARALGRPVDDGGLLARIETEGFAPGSAPLAAPLRADADALAKRWLAEARKAPPKRAAAAVVLLVALVPSPARADAALDSGRAAYQDALAQGDATARRAAFGRAAAALAEVAAAHPDSPGVLTDWGNAALGAGDVGVATLAYRRALASHSGDARARRNLTWLRARQPDTLRPAADGAAQALFFFHDWTIGRRLVVGAAAFALALLLAAPWSPRRRRLLLGLAALPAAIWLAMTISVLAAEDRGHDAVVLESAVLRAADSPGAPAALSSPLPAGVELTVLERRAGWSRVALASGTTGWLPDGALALVAAAPVR